MANKFALVLLIALVVAEATAAPQLYQRFLKKRAIHVDNNGFYLGGGSNNNLREASQIFDIGGPIVNPWINPWTQPLPRSGIVAIPVPVPAPVPVPVAAPVADVATPVPETTTYAAP